MEEGTIIYRLDSIDRQLSELVELSKQTALQEIRIAQNEKDIHNLQSDVAGVRTDLRKLDKRGGDIALKWAGMVAGGILTILLGFIAVRLGLK